MTEVIQFPRTFRDRIEVLSGTDKASGKEIHFANLVTGEGQMIIADYANRSAMFAALGPLIEEGIEVVVMGRGEA